MVSDDPRLPAYPRFCGITDNHSIAERIRDAATDYERKHKLAVVTNVFNKAKTGGRGARSVETVERALDRQTVDHTTVTFEEASDTHVDKKSGDPRQHEEDVDSDRYTDCGPPGRARDPPLQLVLNTPK